MKTAYTVTALEAQADRVLAWRGALEETFPLLAELGYAGVELMVRAPEQMDAQAVQALASQHGLSIPVVGTGPIGLERGITLAASDERQRGEAIRAAKAAIQLCGQFKAVLNIGQFRGRCEPHEVPLARVRLADSLEQLLRPAEQAHIRIALEPQNRFQSSYLRTAQETLEFIHALGSDRVGLVLDTFHMNIEEHSFVSPFKLAPERVFHVHFSDNQRGAPGTGLIPFRAVVDALNETAYSGWIAVEIAQDPSPLEAARTAAVGLHRILQGPRR